MAATQSLHEHLVDELADLLDAENQLTKALPKLAQSAASSALRAALQKHLKETRGQIARLNQAMKALGEKPKSKTCKAMQGLLDEGDHHTKDAPAGALRDAVIITGAQKVEHYEMASYGTARTYAQVLGEKGVARLLQQTLNEEKAADRTLTSIAERSINARAAEEWQAQDEESALTRTAEWAGATAAYASRQFAKGVKRAASAVGMAGDQPASRSHARRGRSTPRRGRVRTRAGKKR
jgi:ferritin-like metal-binding protein YciE